MVGDRLRFARSQRGWTLEALSGHTHIPVSSLSEFETGRREPRLAHLEALARAHGKPLGWFFDPSVGAAEVVLWRDRPVGQEAAAIEARFIELCRWYRNLEEWCDERRPCMLPDARPRGERFDWADAQHLANTVRLQLDLGQRPAASLLGVLENGCGVRVFHLDFEPTGTAACTRDKELGMAVLLNAGNKRWRRNFDLAHELFHLLTWHVFRNADAVAQSDQREEQLADRFASCLLMPEEALRDAVAAASGARGSLRHVELFDVARQFDVSVEALLWRIHAVYRRDAVETERDLDVCRRFRDAVEVREDTRPPSLPERYRALAVRALLDGRLSIGRAAQYLGMSRKDVMALDGAGEVKDDPIALDPA